MRAMSGPREVAHHCFFRGGAVLFPTLASVLRPPALCPGETRPGGSAVGTRDGWKSKLKRDCEDRVVLRSAHSSRTTRSRSRKGGGASCDGPFVRIGGHCVVLGHVEVVHSSR